ncbi:hypothetical protein P0Y35_00145 [Kiritimatiellaeota bacterium B1221]|nr:hypothetical protein [Kiritimatiellaeota bacterium B1221]
MKLPILISALASLALLAVAFWWAPLNQDEGWYLMAARRVSQGHMPYRDFAFTQAPLFPYVFQFAQPLISTMGLAGGRLVNIGFSLLTFLVLHRSLRYFVPRPSRAFAFLLLICILGLNVFQAQYTVTVKTYPLAGFLLTLSMLGWISYQQTHRRSTLMLCALALAAATATRLSVGLFFLPLGFTLLGQRKSDGQKAWISFALLGLLGLSLFFLPFLLLAPEGFKFGLLDFHAAREVNSSWLLKAGFLSRVLQSYLPAVLALFCLLPNWKRWQPGSRSLCLGIFAVTLLHLLAPFPYDDYQVALYPLLALLITIETSHQLPGVKQIRLAPFLLMACLLFAFSSPQLPRWFSNGQDRIWFKTKAQSDLALLREKAELLRTEFTKTPTKILTMDTYIPIENGMEIPRGLEMGPFSYFPDLDTEDAKRYQVVNQELLMDLIRNSDADIATFSGYTFAIESPWITPTADHIRQIYWDLMLERFNLITVFENFGQGPSQLVILADSELRQRLGND